MKETRHEEVTFIAGMTEALDEDTGIREMDPETTATRRISLTVSMTKGDPEIAEINDRLAGRMSKGVHTTR